MVLADALSASPCVCTHCSKDLSLMQALWHLAGENHISQQQLTGGLDDNGPCLVFNFRINIQVVRHCAGNIAGW